MEIFGEKIIIMTVSSKLQSYIAFEVHQIRQSLTKIKRYNLPQKLSSIVEIGHAVPIFGWGLLFMQQS